jgi:phosphoglycolate phosphatase
MSPVHGILFDKDGTLFDFQATWAAVTGNLLADLSAGDPVLEARLAEAAGYDLGSRALRPGSIVVAHTLAETADALLAVMPRGTDRARVIEQMLQYAETAPQVEAVPLIPYFEALGARGLKLGIATNDAEAAARAHLGRAGVEQVFDFIAGYDSGFGAKPAPGQLIGFCDATGLSPDEVIMVGDSGHDLISARAAGMRAVAVLTGLASADELAPGAEAVLPHIGLLPDWLDAL